MTINRKLRGIRDPVDPGYILGRPPHAGRGPAVQLKADVSMFKPSGGFSGGSVTITLTGDVTGTGTGSIATTIANDAITTVKIINNAVTNAKLADMAAWTVKVRNAGSSGDPSDAAKADFTEETTPAAGDFVIGFLATGELRKYDIGNIAAAGSWIPLVDGSEPPNFITDGAGKLITVFYTP